MILGSTVPEDAQANYQVRSVQTTPSNINTVGMPSSKKGKRNIQGMPQSQTAALPRHQEEEEIDKTKQTQIEQTYEKRGNRNAKRTEKH